MKVTLPNTCRLPVDDAGTPCATAYATCPHPELAKAMARLLAPLDAAPALAPPTAPDAEDDAPVSEHGPALDHDPGAGVLPVPLPLGFPAAPAEACATIMLCGHEIEVCLRDIDEARLMARMGGFIQAWCEGDEAHGEEEDGEDDVN